MNAASTGYRFLAATVFAVLTIQSPAGTPARQTRRPAESPLSQPARAKLSRDYGNLPLAFEPNLGQTDARVRFLARGGGMTAFFTDTETAMVLSRSRHANKLAGPGREEAPAGEAEQTVVRMKLENASGPRRAIGLEKLPGISNYFIGNDPVKWRTNVPQYARIQYEGVYPGIDLVWYVNQRRLEYDFVVSPGADPKQIQVAYEGVESLEMEANGDLVLQTALGEVRQQKPRVYQEIGGRQVEVAAQYALVAHSRVSIALADYDRKRELRIDPVVLVYSTYLGGTGNDGASGIAVDAAGSAYVTGVTSSTNFPTQSPYQATLRSGQNAFVTKLTPAGNGLLYSTYLGGNGIDVGSGIAVDAAGSAYVTGDTTSTNFPTQSPYQATLRGGQNAFVTKLTPAGNGLLYSTYLGGSGGDYGSGIAVDAAGSAYVTGDTTSTNFPTQSPYQATLRGTDNAYVTKLTPAGNALAYSTYLGGNGTDYGQGIAVDGAGSAYVSGGTSSTNFPTQSPYQATLRSGQNAFVTKLTPAGNGLLYSTYLGGNGTDIGRGIAVDGAGSAYVTGVTSSTNFPTQSPYQATYQGGTDDAFVTKLTPAGNALAYSTYLGGNGLDDGMGIAVDAAGSAYVMGGTESTNFPTQSPYQATFQGTHDAFVTRLTPAGNALVYSTYLGGSNENRGWDIALDAAGSVYITGYTSSTNFPTQSPYQATFQGGAYDAYVAKLSGATGNIDLSNIGVFRSGMFALDLDQGTYTYNANTTKFRYFGLPGDQPVAGDWLGTGVFSLGVFRAGAWYFDLNNNGQFDANEGPFFFGLPGDAAIVGDWTGSGSTKVGVFRCPASGVCTWYLSSATQTAATLVPSANLYNPATTLVYSYGLPGDQPVANNWSGTVKVDQIGVFRCLASGVCSWIVENVGDGVYRTSDPVYSFGLTGDIAVVGDWNDGNQRKRIGVFRSGLWILEVNGTNTYASNDLQAFFGLPGDKPVVGKWTMP